MKIFRYYIFLIFFLCSCHIGEDYENEKTFVTDNEVKKNLQLTDRGKNVSQNWYYIFEDEDLNTLLKNAEYNNLTIQQAMERLKQARLQYAIQSKENLPMIDGNGSYNYNKAHTQNTLSADVNAFKLGFDATWELDLWGAGFYLSEQYFELMKEAEYSLFNTKTMITAEIVSNYISLREAQEKLRIAKNNLLLQKDILKTIKDRYSAGIADDLALNQAQYTVEQTTTTIPALDINIEQAKNALAVLLGVTPKNLPINLNKCKKNIVTNTFKYSVKELYNLPLDIIRTRPDIMAAEAKVQSQHAAVNQAVAGLYPTLNLSATFGYISHRGHSLIAPSKQNYGYVPGLTTPIWHWNQLTNNVELQKHIKKEDVLNYNEAMLTALSDIKNTITTVEKNYIANQHFKNAVNKMQNIINLTREKYKNGLVDFTDVATAEQNLLSAQTAFAESNAQILQSIIAFYKATGGGYNLR